MVLNNNIKLVIFDLDGTLIDSQYDLTDAVNFTRQQYGFGPLPVKEVASYLGSGIATLVKSVLPELDGDELNKAVKMFKGNYSEHLTDKTLPYNEVAEMLSAIPQQKVLLSNKDEKFSKQILETLGLSKYFTEIYGGDSFKEKKPSPLPIYEILKKFSLNKENVIMVGDGANDIMVAKNAGIKVIGTLYGYSSLEQLQNYGADYIATNPKNIASIIANKFI